MPYRLRCLLDSRTDNHDSRRWRLYLKPSERFVRIYPVLLHGISVSGARTPQFDPG